MREEILRMEHIFTKRKGQYALYDFKLNIYKGEIVIAFGFSGNGLHELGEILSGNPVERGRMLLKEQEIPIRRKFYPEQHGIYVVHNKNNLVPDLTLAENLFLGEKRNIFALPVSKKKQERLAQDTFAYFGLDFDVREKARKYYIYYEQMLVKMVKAYVKGASLVVINEILELPESQWLSAFHRIAELLRQDGISVLWLTQRIENIQSLADRIIVVRHGRNVKTFYGNDCSRDLLMQTATEQGSIKKTAHPPIPAGKPVFCVQNLSGRYFHNLTLEVRRQQIIGIWSNQALALENLYHVTCGSEKKYTGQMTLKGQPFKPANYEDTVKSGMEHIDFMWPEKHYLPDMSITDNLMLPYYWFHKHHYGLINETQRQYVTFRYRQRHPDWPTGTWRQLTPDQQRLLLYEKILDQPGSICIITEPFSRVNYYLAEEIRNIFQELTQKGKTLLLFSMNYWDLCRICDEICLLPEGYYTKKISKKAFDSESL